MVQMLRKPEVYGDVSLSVQASSLHYCEPRVDSLRLDEYGSVEIALFHANFGMCRPSDVGIDGFDHLFEDGFDPVAGYVPLKDVERLREALRTREAARGEAS